MNFILSITVLMLAAAFTFFQQASFGGRPTGERLALIKKSGNYRKGKFQNLSPTPSLAEGYNYFGVLYNFIFGKKDDLVPKSAIPSVTTDLQTLPPEQDLLVWFGHSSYLLQLEGKTILVDPVLNGYAAPFSWMNKAFKGANTYQVEDLPFIDYLLITHDHYDHLDYETVKALREKVGKVVCALGVGAHLEKWGYPASQLIEEDWGDAVDLDDRIKLYFTPARHFSGRSIFSNNTLWTSYVLKTPARKIFVGGDSGYDKHFAAIGEQFGGFDLAILENGQYNEAWRYIHTMPEEVLQAGKDLRARRTFPVHFGKFDLGGHAWNEPLTKITQLNEQYKQTLVTPMIGQVVQLANENQEFERWWEQLIKPVTLNKDDMKLKITVGQKVLTATAYDNPTARDFLSLLPITLTLQDYDGTEKVSDLPRKLTTADAPAGYKPSVGDITYYAPWGNLALFYKDFSFASGLVAIGKIDGEADAFKTSGPVRVTIELLP
ncbi:cyclophilin-like fold protein [Botryobacter ruber]|uniref:cyclophilin-like fold protein n=1 Tax=Botryobacter ruber TaxID=2171629 RepID=UPI000E0B668C|nr:cyclophilin-like fold protein [Botryobacter ruber]